MKTVFLFLIYFGLSTLVLANDYPDPLVILDRIDQNRVSNHIISTSSLKIHSLRGSRTIKAKTWTQSTERSFTEYLAPAREKGTKMLKLQKNLWTYYPKADRIVKIAGHMLRQSVMGSDLSYEDLMENQKLSETYDAVVETEATLSDRACWVLALTAKSSKTAYQKRKIWVDQERFLPLKEELFTSRGKLLKVMEMQEVFQVQGRWYPKKLWFKDALKQGKGTEIVIDSIDFDSTIPDSRFSKRALRR